MEPANDETPFTPETGSTETLSGSEYFPTVRRSSDSSDSSAQPDFHIQAPHHLGRADSTSTTASTSSQIRTPLQLDALSREFPKPTHEASVEEMLARTPPKWSLGHYVKHARDPKPIVLAKDQQTKEFEQIKKELLRAKEELGLLAIGPRR